MTDRTVTCRPTVNRATWRRCQRKHRDQWRTKRIDLTTEIVDCPQCGSVAEVVRG